MRRRQGEGPGEEPALETLAGLGGIHELCPFSWLPGPEATHGGAQWLSWKHGSEQLGSRARVCSSVPGSGSTRSPQCLIALRSTAWFSGPKLPSSTF